MGSASMRWLVAFGLASGTVLISVLLSSLALAVLLAAGIGPWQKWVVKTAFYIAVLSLFLFFGVTGWALHSDVGFSLSRSVIVCLLVLGIEAAVLGLWALPRPWRFVPAMVIASGFLLLAARYFRIR